MQQTPKSWPSIHLLSLWTFDPISTRVMYIVPRSHTNTAQWGEPENKLNYAMFKVHGNSQAASLVVNGLAV